MRRILFVCVENSCRSQMAEGFARQLGTGWLEPWSAGSKPSGKVDGRALRFMREKGVSLEGQTSKGFTDLPSGTWDVIVTMGCGDACPTLPASKRLDWQLPDPKGLSDDEFRRVRDEIESHVRQLLGK